MMDSPFYRSSHWKNSPRYPPNSRAIPIATSQTTPSHKPKVVSIPVHFIQPAENCSKPPVRSPSSRSDYAIRIQKLWRGFRVRKNIKKMREIQREVDEVERIILDAETAEAIRRDERERLRVSERLMSLLFRLDSVGGFDGAVKDLRRAFIRRAIVLQEKVDSIAVDQPPLDGDEDDGDGSDAKVCEGRDSDSDSKSCGTSLIEEGERDLQEEPVEREVVVVKEEKSNSVTKEEMLLERMTEENKRLMALMGDLFDRSEMQTQMLRSLSDRVGQLENAFACEKQLRRRRRAKKSKVP